jgi:hypothetical protein
LAAAFSHGFVARLDAKLRAEALQSSAALTGHIQTVVEEGE